MHIRPIEASDNKLLAVAIRSVLIEMGVPKVGTAYADVELDAMFETYLDERAIYYVVYEGENIPENQKSIAISVTIQSSEKTLNDNDLENINNLIIKTVESKTGAKIRS
jgi:hypothetical protein